MMPGVLQEHLVEEFGVPLSNILKWLKNKDEILREAADSIRKNLIKMRTWDKIHTITWRIIDWGEKGKKPRLFGQF